ncbi:MAG: ferrous iron transport protein A [Phycisphaerae bacterium]|nr:ferrous iron transport protein A [Phycisphaerae bacterium]
MSEDSNGRRPVEPDQRAAKFTMPLAMASLGQEVELVTVNGGRGLLHRLAELGLRTGVRFRILTQGQPGPFIILLKDTRLVLGQGMVHRILVRPV